MKKRSIINTILLLSILTFVLHDFVMEQEYFISAQKYQVERYEDTYALQTSQALQQHLFFHIPLLFEHGDCYIYEKIVLNKPDFSNEEHLMQAPIDPPFTPPKS